MELAPKTILYMVVEPELIAALELDPLGMEIQSLLRSRGGSKAWPSKSLINDPYE